MFVDRNAQTLCHRAVPEAWYISTPKDATLSQVKALAVMYVTESGSSFWVVREC